MPILQLSIEILQAIIFEISRPSDLLALSLTCRALYSAIITEHLPYRAIKTCTSKSHIWRHIMEYPGKARRIRSLQLYPYNGGASLFLQTLSPKGVATDGREEEEEEIPAGTLALALTTVSKMQHLEYLQFSSGTDEGPEFLEWLSKGGTQAKTLLIYMNSRAVDWIRSIHNI
ncbi:hypothetical protein M422DRAFT_202348 [Sphaerobolus stellatus SS14]|nr:hypothetical protein M422DRAFT_202348 [Sphaerobolus stellatus SS14]